jgi:cytochrome c oxidase subunit I+III
MIVWFWPARASNAVARALERWPSARPGERGSARRGDGALRRAGRADHAAARPGSGNPPSASMPVEAQLPQIRTVTLPQPDSAAAAASTLDVRALPSFGFSHRSLMWWATAGLMVIEGTVFAMAVAIYFYLRGVNAAWPLNAPPPALLWGTLNTVVLLLSLWPNQLAKRAAERGDRPGACLWLTVCLAFALVFLVLRGFEFSSLNVMWYGNAYGSIVWLLLGLHTTHLVTDTVDTAVLAVLLKTGPYEGKRLLDTSENAIYWYFVVLSWLPIYAVLYLAPRIHL